MANIDIEKVFSCYEVQCTITRYLALPDLKSLRLVNKQWMDSALPALKSKSQVILNSPTIFSKYLEFLEESDKSFSNYMITFKPDKFECINEAYSLFLRFWDLCSFEVKEISLTLPWTFTYPVLDSICFSISKIEKLSLALEDVDSNHESKWTSGEDKEEGDKTRVVTLTSLTSLNLIVSIVLNAEKKVFPFTWNDFLTACSQLSHLSIHSDYGSGHFYKIVHGLVEKRMGLKTLKIGTRDQRLFSDDFLKELLLVTTSQTETISFGFLPSVKHETPLDSMLSKSSRSLKHLTFLQIRTVNQSTIICLTATDSCAFPNLESLRITKELTPNLNFLRKMPKLKRLEIFRDSTIGQQDTLSNPVIKTRELPVMNNLTSLVLEPFIPVEDVWKLTRWFPNLQRLQLKVTDVSARIIFMSWSGLKELYLVAEIIRDNNDIVRSTLTDEGITGISKEVLKQLYPLGNMSEMESSSITSGSRDVAYIGNLKKLEVCKLQAIPDYQSGLTDYSVYYGLKDLPNLACLTLVKTLVSSDAADELRRKNISVTITKG